MTTRPTYIGRREYNVTDVSAEHRTLAESDEKVGQLLIGQGPVSCSPKTRQSGMLVLAPRGEAEHSSPVKTSPHHNSA